MKLYPEHETGRQSTKKPVVVESYNEIVFPDPSENFWARVQNHPAVLVPRLPTGYDLPTPGKISCCTLCYMDSSASSGLVCVQYLD